MPYACIFETAQTHTQLDLKEKKSFKRHENDWYMYINLFSLYDTRVFVLN